MLPSVRLSSACVFACLLLVEAAPGQGDGAFTGFPATETIVVAPDAESFDNFGLHMALDGDTLAVGSPFDDDVAVDAGSVYVYVRSGGSWSLQAKLTAFDAATGDLFGETLSLDGDDLIVGAYQDDQPTKTDAGAAYVYRRTGTTWNFVQKLVASDGSNTDWFGASVDIDGDYAVVGAPQNDVTGVGTDVGTLYVFQRVAGVWSQVALLLASDAATNDRLGYSAAISGTTLVGSAPFENTVGLNGGSVYVFTDPGTGWVQQQKLNPALSGVSTQLGRGKPGLDIEGDRLIACGYASTVSGVSQAGAVWVYDRSGSVWTEQTRLTAASPTTSAWFGWAARLDGDRVAVGAMRESIGTPINAGSAYLFINSGGTWAQYGRWIASVPVFGDGLGHSIGLAGDTIAAGCRYDDPGATTDAGSVYVFDYDGAWTDLGGALAGTSGAPQLDGSGLLLFGSPGALTLSNAAPSATSILFTSFANTPTPFKGGLLVTLPIVFQLTLITSPAGGWSLPWPSWPANGPSGFDVYYQTAIVDGGAVQGVALSNALQSTLP